MDVGAIGTGGVLDTWTSIGLVVVGVERQGLRFSLSHIGEDGVARVLHEEPYALARGLRSSHNAMGRAVQRAAWAALAVHR